MIPRSLVGRMTLLQLALAGSSVVLFAASALFLSAKALERQERRLLSNTAHQLVNGLVLEWREERDLARAAKSMLDENAPVGVRVEVQDAARQPVLVSGADAGGDASHVDTVEAAVPGGAWIVVSASSRPREGATCTSAAKAAS